MGLAGGFVKKIFSKTRSSASGRYGNEKNAGVGKGAWRLGKLKFCGDDIASVPDEADACVSLENSKLVTTQVEAATQETETVRDEQTQQNNHIEEEAEENNEENYSESKSLGEESAAIVIQSAYLNFLARRQRKMSAESEEKEISSRISMGTSVVVQVGDSVKKDKCQGSIVPIQQKMHHKARQKTPQFKEWDDSTVSSNVSKLRIKNRHEAMTRRERALAYAFSQQLRTCSRKSSTQCGSQETNPGWNWLERWMAAWIPEHSSVEGFADKKADTNTNNRKSLLLCRQLDVSFEGKESCASNDIPVSSGNFVMSSRSRASSDMHRVAKHQLKPKNIASHRNYVPTSNRLKPLNHD